MASWRNLAARVLAAAAVATATPAPTSAASPASPWATEQVAATREYEERIRKMFGGQLTPLPVTVTRWHLADLETAIHLADTGDLSRAAQLCRSLRRDGVLAGVLGTRTGGLVRLPKKFSGRSDMVAVLKGKKARRGLFERMFPAPELALLAGDGILLGVGIAEMVEVPGLPHKVMRRLDPEFLRYRWNEGRWYYHSLAGPIPITPGDGRWILHTPGGGHAPWQHGLWAALGRAWIAKDHAFHYRENYSSKLAHPARVAVAPQGATDEQHQSWFRAVMAWGVNSVFGMKPGYDVKLVESNGRGYDVFTHTIETSDKEVIVALAGQIVTTTGGSGFANADVHKSIRADLIQDTAECLELTINTQGIPPWVNFTYGGDALDEAPEVSWDVSPPKDLKATAESYSGAAKAITELNTALKPYGIQVDADAILLRFGIPIDGDEDGDTRPEGERAAATPANDVPSLDDALKAIDLAKQVGLRPTADTVQKLLATMGIAAEPIPAGTAPTARLEIAPTDVAKVVRVDEVRASQQLPPIGDDRGQLTIGELDAKTKAASAPPLQEAA